MDRIAPGHHLYPGPDGSWRHSTPDGRFTRIRGPQELLLAAQRSAYGAENAPAVPEGSGDGRAQALLDGLRTRGALAATEPPTATTGRTVHIEGAGPVADAIAALLAPRAEVVTGPLDEDAVRAADVAVSCPGWLPDAHWRQVDTWCARHAVPWHRVHAEGTRFVVGPLAAPGRTVGYADTRGRLLAAADLPDELATHWAYLDQGHAADTPAALPPVPRPTPAVAALLAGLVVEDLFRLHATGLPAAPGVQLLVDPETLTVTRHRVLPLPTTAGTPR